MSTTLPMTATYEGVVRYLRATGNTREQALEYFAPEDREEAGREYDRQTRASLHTTRLNRVLAAGTKVRTHETLGSTARIMTPADALARRQADSPGIIDGVVPGHGGDVYWVDHGTGQRHAAPYCFDEFEVTT